MQAKKEMNITKIAAFFKYNAAMIGLSPAMRMQII